MKSFSLQLAVVMFFSSYFSLNAQIQALFNDKSQARNMTQRWELDTTSVRGTFLLTPYKPIYVLPIKWSSSPNEKPVSANTGPDYISPDGVNYNSIEAKFQLSFKTKILQGVFWGHGDLWVGYTQVSHWQIYNVKLSRPFREINYEPELILNIPVKFNVFGFKTRMLGVAFNHESNGKSNPFSRSWNRIIFHAGMQRDNWSFYVRPWIFLRGEKDDNPDIVSYIGRGDLNVIYTNNGNILSFIGTHNLNFNSKFKGGASFSWSYPIKNNLKGFFQVSHGYGESMIDYNHLQTSVGIGVSLIEWF